MPVIFSIALRNLLRQTRRSLLLGIAIAFGACVLILANAFSHGISKVLFEKIVKYTNGHVAISFMKNGNMMTQIFHDGDRIRDIIKREAPEALRVEEAIGIFGRAIGNGVADNVILVGVDISGTMTEKELKEFEANFKMLEGSFDLLGDKSEGTPVLIAEQKAKYLQVKKGDVLKVRFTGVNNQTASAKLVVAGIFKPANIFMASPIFLELKDLRRLAGYAPSDIPTLQINLKQPQKYAKAVANRIHQALKPGLALMQGTLSQSDQSVSGLIMGLKSDSASRRVIGSSLKLIKGDSASLFLRGGAIASWDLAQNLGIGIGDTLTFTWQGKFDTSRGLAHFPITAMGEKSAPLPNNLLLVNDRDFYRWYYMPLPTSPSPTLAATLPDTSHPLYHALAPEFTVMKRVKSTTEYAKTFRELSQQRVRGIVVSVQSMYETASAIINVEIALHLITLVAGLVLFFVILIGVINTLRMTIRERTREIGTVRAIGMQRRDVLNMFLAETGLLALISSLVGTVLAFILMFVLSSFTINAGDNPMGMILVNSRLFFAPTVFATISYIFIIILMALVTAYFPARRASKLSAANAMRHYE